MEVQGGSLARVGENKAGGRNIRGEGKGEMGAEGGGGREEEKGSLPLRSSLCPSSQPAIVTP